MCPTRSPSTEPYAALRWIFCVVSGVAFPHPTCRPPHTSVRTLLLCLSHRSQTSDRPQTTEPLAQAVNSALCCPHRRRLATSSQGSLQPTSFVFQGLSIYHVSLSHSLSLLPLVLPPLIPIPRPHHLHHCEPTQSRLRSSLFLQVTLRLRCKAEQGKSKKSRPIPGYAAPKEPPRQDLAPRRSDLSLHPIMCAAVMRP